MTHILFKPHVSGPENNITTPDIVVDRAVLRFDGEQQFVPVHRVQTVTELQAVEGECTLTPAFGIVAAGGGALLCPAVILQSSDQPVALADILIARLAWRLRNLLSHFPVLQLKLTVRDNTSSLSFSELDHPRDFMHQQEDELVMPHGVIGICAAPAVSMSTTAPAKMTLQLSDPELDRNLSHVVRITPVSVDRWDERPIPRYSVGPVGEVQHYI